jgi:hypothetical protein
MSEEQNEQHTVGRRRLLRRATTVAAGIAGAGVVGAATAAPAQAAAGDPVVQGADNDAGTGNTRLRASSPEATLALGNNWTTTDPDTGAVLAGPALRLNPSGDAIADSAVGSIGMANNGDIWTITGEYNGRKLAHIVRTTMNSNTMIPLKPQRVIDTRYAASRTRILNPAGNLDSTGRVIGLKAINIDLTDYMYYADAVFGNITVVPTGTSFASVYPYATPRPTAFSTVNFYANQIISNSFVVGVGYDTNLTDGITVYANALTHVIVDITAVMVSYGSVNPAYSQWGLTNFSQPTKTPNRAALAQQGRAAWDK